MSAITSKAIVITAYPGKHGSITLPARNGEFAILDTVDFDSDDSNTSGGGPKKRRRLTHLSPDEKLLRRKLKNRVAAQTARDRKKALMVELEEKVSQLEEENKLLKRQNFTLKEASSTLAKENAVLKSQLADQPLTTTKTDSETTSTRCSSAEGAGSDFVSVGGSVLHLCGNSQPDDFMGLLQELAEDSKCKQSQAQTATPFSQSVDGGDNCTDNSIRANHRTTSCGMVGLSPAELESLNELISIDHVYFKPQPISLQRGKEGQHKSSVAVRIHTSNGSIISPPQKCSSSLKRKQACELSEKTISLVHPSVPSPASDIELDTVNHDFPLLQLSSSQPLPSPESCSVVTDDFINSLSDSDMESSLNFFQDLDFNLIESNITADDPKTDSHISNIYFNNTQDITPSDDVLENEINATKLFDEIYEHYLNIKETSSPDSAILSDSGISSDLDLDAASPQSIEESLHDEMWHDTSFADLFPDLQ